MFTLMHQQNYHRIYDFFSSSSSNYSNGSLSFSHFSNLHSQLNSQKLPPTMSFSDSETSTEYKPFKQISRDRLLYEMLRSARSGDSKAWKVLIMDKVTVKVMSHSCKMADITDQEVSSCSVVMFLSDMSGREPLYKKAYVFFSSPIPKELVNHIKSDTSVLPRIGALREMNLEYFPIDSQAFITDQETALEELYGNVENTRRFNTSMNNMAIRIATVFASLKFKASKHVMVDQDMRRVLNLHCIFSKF